MSRSHDRYSSSSKSFGEHHSTHPSFERIKNFGRAIVDRTKLSSTELTPAEYITEPTSELYQHLFELFGSNSAPLVTRYVQQMRDRTGQLPNYDDIKAHEEALQNLYIQRNNAPLSELDVMDEQVRTLISERKVRFDRDEYTAAVEILYHLKDFNESKRIFLKADDNDVVSIIDLIREAPTVYDDMQSDSAPFSTYASNTNEAWAYVPSAEVGRFLDSKMFISDTDSAYNHMTGYELSIHQTGDYFDGRTPIAIPSRLVVNAAGFDSWRGRGVDGQDDKYTQSRYSRYEYDEVTTSNETIKHYAALPSDLPPVTNLNVYIQPNGKVFADNGGGDSHRIAAAFLRGNEFIEAENVTVRLLARDVI